MGALLVETPEGLPFRIGTGFTIAQREDPPRRVSWVTDRFRGQHVSGRPQLVTLLRVRADADADLSGLPVARP